MAEPVRSDEYGARPNRGQVERARVERQTQAGDRAPANINDAPNATIRNTNVVRFGEVRDTSSAKKNPDQIFNPDTATTFNESYTRAGIQPSNINTEPKKTNAQNYSENTRQSAVQYFEPEEDFDDEEIYPTTPKTVKVNKKANAVKREIARAKATGINVLALSIAGTLFIPQVVLAVLSTIFLGLGFFVEWLFSTATIDTSADVITVAGKIFKNLIARGGDALFNAVNTMTKLLLGIDLTAFDPTNLFWITYAASVGVGWFILLIMLLMYMISFVRCLSGERANLKRGMFILAMIGHAIPVANILPWFVLWGVIVWMYPK